MGGKWPNNCYFVGCCLLKLINITHSILVKLPSSFFFTRFVSIYVVHPYSCIDTTTAWKKLRFILSVRSDFHVNDSLSIAAHAFANPVLMSVLVEETLLPRKVNLSTTFRELPLIVETSPVQLKHIYSVLCALAWRPMPAAAHSRLCCRVSAWAGALARSARLSPKSASVTV